MKYYTEGYVKTITMAGKTTTSPKSCPVGQLLLAKPTTITIEPIQPFKFEQDQDGDNFILFVEGDVKTGEKKEKVIGKAAGLLGTASEFACETFDAQFILSLKQSRVHVRFYIELSSDNTPDKLPKITELVVLQR